MLQQTQVVTVIPYFQRFLAKFPHVRALARADEADVLRLWEGLGYYRRARQMHVAARQVVEQHRGEFPTELADVRALPGIGRYTAGAILSIACDQRLPIVEANTVRLYSRLMAYEDDPTSRAGQTQLWEFAESILPRTRVGAFNQALMELGSEICTPRQPACDRCPLATLCPTQARSLQTRIPAMKKKPAIEALRQACVIVWRKDRVLLRKCGDDERWAGMWDFPRFDLHAQRGPALDTELRDKVVELTGIRIRPATRLVTLNHCVTRYRIQLACYQADHDAGNVRGNLLAWVRPAKLHEYPLNVTARKICKRLCETP